MDYVTPKVITSYLVASLFEGATGFGSGVGPGSGFVDDAHFCDTNRTGGDAGVSCP